MALKIVVGHGCRMRNGNTFGAHKNYLYAASKRHQLTNMPVVVQRRQAGRRAHAHAREISTQDQRQQATGRQAKGAGQDNDSDEDGSVQFEFEPGTTQIQARVR